MKEEDNIRKKVSTENPFTVPEGYFDNLTDEIMSKLPEKEEILPTKELSTWAKIRPWLYMAAMFIAILLPIRYMVNSTKPKDPALAIISSDNEQVTDEYIDAILDHAMMDDYTLYNYLTEADTDIYHN
jgi:hypothetical protein